MDYKKKLKIRLYTAISYIVIGIILIVLCFSGVIDNEYLSSLGLVCAVIGVGRIRQYKIITKDEESIRHQRIVETDERNIAILHKAKSTAFGIYTAVACAAVIVFEIIDKDELSFILAISVCALLMIYLICYWIYQKRS